MRIKQRTEKEFRIKQNSIQVQKKVSKKIMDGTKEQYGFYAWTRVQLDNRRKIHEDLQAVYGTIWLSPITGGSRHFRSNS